MCSFSKGYRLGLLCFAAFAGFFVQRDALHVELFVFPDKASSSAESPAFIGGQCQHQLSHFRFVAVIPYLLYGIKGQLCWQFAIHCSRQGFDSSSKGFAIHSHDLIPHIIIMGFELQQVYLLQFQAH